MGIVPTNNHSSVISKAVAAFQVRLENATLYLLKFLGESLVKYAKEKHSYTDRTGNLTNSISYAIVRNKKLEYFSEENQPNNEGAKASLNVAMQMANSLPDAFSLIIVAGMNYAAYVEAKGYNVILPAELKAKKDFPAAMNTLMAKAKAKANELFGGVL
jgi:hypothetical protein